LETQEISSSPPFVCEPAIDLSDEQLKRFNEGQTSVSSSSAADLNKYEWSAVISDIVDIGKCNPFDHVDLVE
jgi:hypothetical protein